jgi:hypothetical protein
LALGGAQFFDVLFGCAQFFGESQLGFGLQGVQESYIALQAREGIESVDHLPVTRKYRKQVLQDLGSKASQKLKR